MVPDLLPTLLVALLVLPGCTPVTEGKPFSEQGDTGIDAGSVDSGSMDSGDGEGDSADTGGDTPAPDSDGDGALDDLDCDDGDADIHPGAPERCDGIDNDCDGAIDGPTSTDASTWYADGDGDGYGDPASTTTDCAVPDGFVSDATDCDDTRADVSPAGVETCDELDLDEDCDTLADDEDADPAGASAWYADADADGYGDDTTLVEACSAPIDTVSTAGDCDDADPTKNPAAAEVCTDPTDYNCDGSTGYADTDGDGVAACEDCDDADADAFPGATEVCDGDDEDCDGTTDEADAADATTWYVDADLDGWGSAVATTVACDEPYGYDDDPLDCDDADANVRPDAPESWYDGIDQDCDGLDDDQDGDGWLLADDCDDTDSAAYPGALETALDGVDQDCDGFDSGADTDGDGIADESEAGIGADALDADTDDDGLDDGEEVDAGTDPADADTDDDGLDDGDEASEGADPLLADTDADGWSDGDEVDRYTDPADATDHPYTGGWSIGSCRDTIVPTGAGVGDIAEDFALLDQHGDTLHLHDFCDRAVLLDFSEFW